MAALGVAGSALQYVNVYGLLITPFTKLVMLHADLRNRVVAPLTINGVSFKVSSLVRED